MTRCEQMGRPLNRNTTELWPRWHGTSAPQENAPIDRQVAELQATLKNGQP